MRNIHWQIPKHKKHVFFSRKSDYCICIPIKNEGENIKKQLLKMREYSKLVDIIVSDWGSEDISADPKFMNDNNVRIFTTMSEQGRQASQLRIAFAHALEEGYKGIIQIDGNNKDGVEAIPEFIKELQNGYDYVQGSRFVEGGKEENTPLRRHIGIRLVTSPILSLAAWYWYTDVTNGFRAYSRKYLTHPDVSPFRDIFVSYSLNFYLTTRANQLGFKTKEIPVSRVYPKGKVPTKMNGISAEMTLLTETLKTTTGAYHPY